MLKTQYVLQWVQFILFWPLLVVQWSDAKAIKRRKFVYYSLVIIMVITPVIGIIHWLYCIDITFNDPENSIGAWCAVYPLMCIMFAMQYAHIHPTILAISRKYDRECQ